MGRFLIFCVMFRPDFEQLSVILSFSLLLFASISVQITLMTQLMHLTNITYIKVNTKNISRYMLCLFLNFEQIKIPNTALKFPKVAQETRKYACIPQTCNF